jgi:thiol-disulfide isomerase/thioredoxin
MKWVLWAALIVAACSPLGCAARRGGTAAERKEPIDFTAPLLSGGTYQLSKDRGHPVVIDVWATWCEPCKDTLPIIDALRREYFPKGVQVYSLNVDSEPTELGKFLTALDVHLPVLLDPNADVADGVLAVHRMPTSFIIDGKGVVRSRHEGVPSDLLKSTRAQLEELLETP